MEWARGSLSPAIAKAIADGRGKSGLHRAERSLIARRGDPTESATEKTPPCGVLLGLGPEGLCRARVKWRGKSAPAGWRQLGLANPARSKAK